VRWPGRPRRPPQRQSSSCTGPWPASPHRVGKPLKLGLDGLHAARRGDYRVIYRIDGQHRRLDVVAIEHRSDIYRPRQF